MACLADDGNVIPFQTTRYRCPHCRKTGSSRKRMQEHADACIVDPFTRACRTCKFDVSHVLASEDHVTKTEKACSKGVRPYGAKLVKRCPSWVQKGE